MMNYWSMRLARQFKDGDQIRFGYAHEAFFDLKGIPLKTEGKVRHLFDESYVEIEECGKVFHIPFPYIELPEKVET